MATIPSVPTEVPGNFWTSALWNTNVLGGLNYLFAPVRFKGYSSTTQSLGSSTSSTVLTLDTETVDSDGGHSTTTNTSRFTAQTAGLYVVTGSVCFATNSAGTRTLQVFLNGAGITGSAVQAAPSASNGTSVYTGTIVQLAVGDYVELAAWQNSGSTLTTSTTNAIATTMCLWRISS
ncbi:hypothetical protein ACWCRD_03085 [Streptomyces sp. NPDC002092]